MKLNTFRHLGKLSCVCIFAAVCAFLTTVARSDETVNDIGRVAARHLNATLSLRYFTYEASVDAACGKRTLMSIAASGTVNLDGWSFYRTDIADYENGPGEVIAEYYLRDDVAVRRSDTAHKAFAVDADTEDDAWYKAATDTFNAEIPAAPGHALLSLFDNTLSVDPAAPKPGGEHAACDMYAAQWHSGLDTTQHNGSITFCIDKDTQLARIIEAEMSETKLSGDSASTPETCVTRLKVTLTPQPSPATLKPPKDVLDIFEKQTGRTPAPTAAKPPPTPCDGAIIPLRVDAFEPEKVKLGGNITAFTAAADGGAWAGSTQGVAQYKNGEWMSYSAGGRFNGLRVNGIAQTADGHVWVGTSGGLFSWDGAAWNIITDRQGLPDNNVLALAASSDRRLVYAATMDGIAVIEDGRPHEYLTKRQFDFEKTQTLFAAKSGLYAGTTDGLIFIDRRMKTTKYLEKKNVHAVAEDADGLLWAGVSGGAIALTGGKTFEYDFRTGLASNNVAALAVDANGCLLAGAGPDGTLPGGLNRFYAGRWRSWPDIAKYASGGVRHVAPAGDGSLWLVTDSVILHLLFK